MIQRLKLAILVVTAAFISALITLFFQTTARRHYPVPLMDAVGEFDALPALRKSSNGIQSPAPSTLTMEDEVYSKGYIPPIYNQNDDALDVDERAIEMRSSQSVVVSDVSVYLQRNKDYIEGINGKVLSYNEGTQAGQGLFSRTTAYGYFDARVPVENFDEVNNQLGQSVQKVVYQSVNAQDVTGEVVSLDEQMINLEDQLAEAQIRLEEADTDLAKLRIENEIKRLEQQITTLENRQAGVDQQVTYAVVSVNAANNEEYFTPTWRSTWQNMIWSVFGSFYGFAYIVGALVIWTVLYSVVWLPIMLGLRWIRRSLARKKS